MTKLAANLLALAALYLPSLPLHAIETITVFALFKNRAILQIDGARRVLATGETSPEGVTLIRTDARHEMVELKANGRREILRLGMISSGGSASAEKSAGSIILRADRNGFFRSRGEINGVKVRFLVDTGANTIAMNSRTAERIGLDYKRHGRGGTALTAGGVVRMYSLKLNRVTIGGITLYNVAAGVIPGDHPPEVLLGMSFLSRLEMNREGNRMKLSKRY